MVLWRISNYADLRGIGGLRAPGRWHFAGQAIVYLAEHPALALLEILVHMEIASVGQLPDGYQLLRVDVDDDVPVDFVVVPGIGIAHSSFLWRVLAATCIRAANS